MRLRGLSLALLVFVCLLAGGCGLAQQWREGQYRRYHNSRWHALARQQALPSAAQSYPQRPAPPEVCRSEIEERYRSAFDAQQLERQQWGGLLAVCAANNKMVSDMTGALARRDGQRIAKLTPELSAVIISSQEQIDAWRASRAEAEGAIQSLQVAWLKVWPGCDFEWDIRVEVERLRQQAVEQELAAAARELQRNSKGGSADARHARQQARNQRLKQLIAYHQSAYGLLAARYLGRASEVAKDADVKVPDFAAALHDQLQQFEASLATRYELDLAIENELDRFEYVTGLSLEEVLELPAEDLWDPENQQAREEIEQRARERKEKIKAGGRGSQGEAGLPLSRRSVWLMLKDGRVPSLEGKKVKQLKGQRAQTVEITLARLEFYRQLDELLTRILNVQQRELALQWELLWPNPPVEADIFEYAKTLPEARTEIGPDSPAAVEDLP